MQTVCSCVGLCERILSNHSFCQRFPASSCRPSDSVPTRLFGQELRLGFLSPSPMSSLFQQSGLQKVWSGEKPKTADGTVIESSQTGTTLEVVHIAMTMPHPSGMRPSTSCLLCLLYLLEEAMTLPAVCLQLRRNQLKRTLKVIPHLRWLLGGTGDSHELMNQLNFLLMKSSRCCRR